MRPVLVYLIQLKPGDVFRYLPPVPGDGGPQEVSEIVRQPGLQPAVRHASSGCLNYFDSGCVVELLRRPWQEGKTESDMIGEVWTAVIDLSWKRYGYPGNRARIPFAFSRMREALDAYQLGLPQERT